MGTTTSVPAPALPTLRGKALRYGDVVRGHLTTDVLSGVKADADPRKAKVGEMVFRETTPSIEDPPAPLIIWIMQSLYAESLHDPNPARQ